MVSDINKTFVADRIGKFIKKERTKQNISIRVLAKDCYISHTSLADLENGKAILPKDIYKIILQNLDIQEDKIHQVSLIGDIQVSLNDFFNYVYYQDKVKIHELFQDLIKMQEKDVYNVFEVDFNIIKLIYYTCCSENEELASELIKCLDRNEKDLTDLELELLYLYKAQSLIDKNILAEAELLLKKVLKLVEDDRIRSLIFQLMGKMYVLDDKVALATTYFIKSKEIFDLKLNYARSLYTCSNMAVAYIYSKAYDEAIKSCNECIVIAERLSLDNVIMINAYNLSYIYMMLEEYEKVNNYVNLSIEHGEPDNGIYWHNAYAFFKLHEYNSCLNWIEYGKSKLLEPQKAMLLLYIYLEYRMKNDLVKSIDILRCILDMKEYDVSFNNQDIKFVIKEIVELAIETNNLEIMSIYGKSIINL